MSKYIILQRYELNLVIIIEPSTSMYVHVSRMDDISVTDYHYFGVSISIYFPNSMFLDLYA